MANIVELREISDEKLAEMIENSREEMFNLRFQHAMTRLEDTSRLRKVRRELAQLQTVLHMRQLAIETALGEEALANALADQEWRASSWYSYEDSAWVVEFSDQDGNELASALVNLNKKRPKGRRMRQTKKQPRLVISYEIEE